MSFFTELRRRNVWRVSALYVIVSWLILQVVDVLASVLQLPDWVGKLVLVLLAIGFPIAVVFSWVFELTPEGVKIDRGEPPGQTARGGQRRKLDVVLIGALILAGVYMAWQHDWSDNGAADSEIRSLAVLPLDNLMDDPDQAFFVAGMHEALITELSKIGALRVISRTSAMSFRDSGKSVPEIARELKVDAVIEGSVLKVGDTVRVTVQLIDGESDRHLWADNFDRELSDILSLYADVTREIAEQVQVSLSDGDTTAIEDSEPVDPDVYELYLKGRYFCDNWSPDEMRQGIELLQKAVSLDPGYAQAHAHLAICIQYSAFFNYQNALEVGDRARAAASMAVEIDGNLAEAHVALAGVQYYLDYNPRAALVSLKRALQLNPSSARALLHASWLLGESGRVEEALEFNRRALRLDPLSTVVNHAIGQVYFLNRDYERAIEAIRKALELDRSDPSLHHFLALALEQTEQFEAAAKAHKRAIELSNGATLYRAGLGYSYGLSGRSDEAKAILDALQDDPNTAAYDLAVVHLGLGNLEAAMDLLTESYAAHESQLIYINRGPYFDPLRKNPRFMRLVEQIDWPEPDEPLPLDP